MTRQSATDVSLQSREPAPRNGAALAQAASTLLADLERSLVASQRALLSRNLEGLERATCEQMGLRRSLQLLWPEVPVQAGPVPQPDPAFAAGLRAAQWRVLYLGRVQAALLTRAQRSLRIVSHRLAGSAASYAAPAYARPAFEPCDAAPPTGAGGDGERPGQAENNRIKTEQDKKEEAGPWGV